MSWGARRVSCLILLGIGEISVRHGGERGGLRRGIVFGDAAAIADALERAAEVCGVFGVLRVAAGGAEFVFDESLAGGI